MKKAVTISIAQTLFAIEEDAYQKLDQYLKSIRDHFIHNKGQGEIIEDIEARISEQFLETKKRVITVKEVEMVIESMGRVEDFDTSDEEDENEPAPVAEKKLYRNPKDKIIAGVCSGLAAYINIDPLWVRIAFVVLTIITSGVWILIYILLAILIPEAKTTSQALEMKGAPVTLETMSQNIKEKVEDIRGKHGSQIKKILSWPFQVLKKMVDFLILFLGPILRIFIGLTLAILTLGSIILLSILVHTLLTNGEEFLDIPFSLITSGGEFWVTGLSIYLLLLIPLVLIFIIGISLLRRKNLVNFRLGMTFLFLWCVSLISGGVAGFSSAADFEKYLRTHELFEEVTKEIEVTSNIKKVTISGDIRLNIIQGTETKLTVVGRSKQLDLLTVDENSDTKDFLYLGLYYSPFCFLCNYDSVEAILTIPDLEAVEGYDRAYIISENWKSKKPMELSFYNSSYGNLKLEAPKINLKGLNNTYLVLDLNSPDVQIHSDNSTSIESIGTIEHAELKAENASVINLTKAQVYTAKGGAYNGSTINLPSLESIEAVAENGSAIIYKDTKVQVNGEASNGSFVGSEAEWEKVQTQPWNDEETDHYEYDDSQEENESAEELMEEENEENMEEEGDEDIHEMSYNEFTPSDVQAEGAFSSL